MSQFKNRRIQEPIPSKEELSFPALAAKLNLLGYSSEELGLP
jgi:hypothetical protein